MQRTLTPARGVALVLIAVAALGLAYARFGAGARHVTVSEGARPTLVVPENPAFHPPVRHTSQAPGTTSPDS